MQYHYKAFNLHFITPFECPELIEIDENNDLEKVIVNYSYVPEKLETYTNSGPTFTSEKDQFILNTKADVKFLIRNGKEIIIDLGESCTLDQMKLLFFGSVMAALFMQKNMLVLHASAIKSKNGAILFCGHSGAGKSTVSESLLKYFKKISDDIIVLYYDEKKEKVMCIPSYPQSKLWKESTDLLSLDTNNLAHVHKRLNKYKLSFKENFYEKELPLDKIYILSTHNKAEVSLTNINKLNAIVSIENQTYRKKFYGKNEYKKTYFNLYVKISKQAVIKNLIRPYKRDSVNEIINMILKDTDD